MSGKKPEILTIMYGSEARGDARTDSDIDLLILVDKERGSINEEENIISPLYDLELQSGVPISARVLPKSVWENRWLKNDFYLNVQNEGILL